LSYILYNVILYLISGAQAANCGKRTAKLLKIGEINKLKITKKQENGWKMTGRKAGRFPVFEEIYQPLNGL